MPFPAMAHFAHVRVTFGPNCLKQKGACEAAILHEKLRIDQKKL
jgi:hypothetical protein